MKALVFGEVLWDIFSGKQMMGGAAFNFAAHFAKHGGQAYLVSAVGKDALGRKTLSEIKKSGVKTDYVRTVDKETGKCIVTLDKDAMPVYNLLDDVAYDFVDVSCINSDNFDFFYFGTLALRSKHNLEALTHIIENSNYKEVFVDVNIRQPFSNKENVRFALSKATVLKISDEELPFITNVIFDRELDYKQAVQKISEKYKNIKIIIVTLGAQGSYAFDAKSYKDYRIKGEKVKAVSTVGAGDSFSASFMYNYLTTGDIYYSAQIATKLSAFVVTKTEAVPDYDMRKTKIECKDMTE